MNPKTNQQLTGNPTLDALLGALVKSGTVSQQQTQPVVDASSYYKNTNNDIMGSVQDMIKNGSGGYAVNAGPATQAWDKNTATTAGIPIQLAENLNNNNTSLLGNLLNAATTQQGNALNYDVGKTNANANKLNSQTGAANSGWTTDASGNITNNNQSSTGISTGNPRIDTYVGAVMNGYKSIGDIPQDIAPRVMQQLQKSGYDAAKPINTDISYLTNLYGINSNPISQANNGGQALKNDWGAFLNFLTGGTYQTQSEQQVKQYAEAANNFKSRYANILGKNIDLPTEKDSPQVAKDKFTKLIKQVQSTYYNGGSGPNAKPSLNSFNQ